jgi:hypothetical protein
MTDTSREMSDLRLADFAPRPTLEVEQHEVRRARFPAIDAHNHLGRWLSRDGGWIARDIPELLRVLDACNITAIVNLDGMWGDELEANLDRYDRAYPERFITFARVDWDLVAQPDFGARMARQLEDSVRRGARGLKVWKTLGLRYRDAQGRLIPIDDERLFDLWEAAAEQRAPVLIHIADPVAFFQPLERFNERWEELHRHPDWHFFLRPGVPQFRDPDRAVRAPDRPPSAHHVHRRARRLLRGEPGLGWPHDGHLPPLQRGHLRAPGGAGPPAVLFQTSL